MLWRMLNNKHNLRRRCNCTRWGRNLLCLGLIMRRRTLSAAGWAKSNRILWTHPSLKAYVSVIIWSLRSKGSTKCPIYRNYKCTITELSKLKGLIISPTSLCSISPITILRRFKIWINSPNWRNYTYSVTKLRRYRVFYCLDREFGVCGIGYARAWV